MVREPNKQGALLDLLFLNTGGLLGDVIIGGHLGHSYHEVTEFLILTEVRRKVSRTFTLGF